jgi:hypothetical protein
MNLPVAILLDAPPSDWSIAWYWLRCILIPFSVILLSWMTVRHLRKPVLPQVVLSLVAALVVLRPAYDLINYGYPFFPSLWFIAASRFLSFAGSSRRMQGA